MKSILVVTSALALNFISCNKSKSDYDAAGAFESVETVISSQGSGTILRFDIEEGQSLQAGQEIGLIDTVQLFLKKKQLEAQIGYTVVQKPNIPVQVAALQEQLKDAMSTQKRIQRLVKENAVPQKQLDDINTRIEVLKKQIEAQESALGIASTAISYGVTPIEIQIAQVEDQLAKCHIINPIHGTVLTKYTEAYEVTAPGKAFYKIAKLDTLVLRVYITGSQLSRIKLGQKVKVSVDDKDKKSREYSGTVFWISDKSEFTPKTIPTKEERADLVYAIKIRVPNDGFLKIGMYGEMKL